MRLAWALGVLATLGGFVIPAHASVTGIDPSSIINDPTIELDDPSCPSGAFCVDLTYTGPSTFFFLPPLIFSVRNPPGEFPVPPVYTCESNIFAVNLALPLFSKSEFTGCLFDLGELTHNEPLTISSLGGPVELTLPNNFSCPSCSDGTINLSPEPGTAILYVSGLLCLVGIIRKRFRADSRARSLRVSS